MSSAAEAVIIAPSGPFDTAAFERGVERIAERLEVAVDPAVYARSGYFAGTDEERIAAFERALAHPTARIIVAARGGNGAARLLPRLSVDAVRDAGKVLVGFSDITALHALWHMAGLPSVHGAVVTSLGRADDAQRNAWFSAVLGESPTSFHNLRAIVAGDAEGPITGGNLAMLAALAGTPHALRAAGRMVLLEDVGERVYRIDRMLTQLIQSGAFDGARAVLLGDFTRCDAGDDGVTAEAVLTERLSTLGIPVYANLPVGHGDINLPVPLGVSARLSSKDCALLVASIPRR